MRRLLLIVSLFTLMAAAIGFGLWHQGALQDWVLKKAELAVIQIYDRKIRGHLPFDVEKIEYERNWAELAIGRLSKVSVTLTKDHWRIHLEGPLRFPAVRWSTFKQLYRKVRDLPLEHADDAIELDYSPIVTFSSTQDSDGSHLPDPLSAELHISLSGEVNDLQDISLTLSSLQKEPNWHWKSMGVELQKPRLTLEWPKTGSLLHLNFESASFAYKENARLVHPQFDLQVPLNLSPFELGSQVDLSWKAESGEALLGDRYFSAGSEPLHGKAEIGLKDLKWVGLKLAIGKSQGQKLHLQATPRASLIQFKLELDPLSLKETIPALLKSTGNAGAPFTSLSFLQDIDFKDGKLSLSANGTAPDFSHPLEGKIEKANLQLDDVSVLWPARALAVKKLHLSIPYVSGKGFEGELSIGRFGYRKLRGRLLPTRLSFSEGKTDHSNFRIGEKGSRIPLDFDGLLLRIDSIAGTAKLSPLEYNLETQASLEPTDAEKVIGPLCLVKPGGRIPPAKIHLSFPKVEISPAVTDLTGYIRADLFGGFIEVDEMGMFNFLSPVPEVDFNLTMEGIDLHSLGEWINFGEMDGTLSAYAHDVVFQSFLPTQYDFEIKAKPLHHDDVVFSPTAMKNFARLFSKEGIDNIPGYAQWLAFGWPSRLLGGYDIQYTGVHIRSEDGYIHLNTLDPVSESDPYNPHQKHFILYGRRFKIPLKSSRYPLILDAPAMGNYVHYMYERLQEMAKSKKGETYREADFENTNPNKDSLPAACIPSDLSQL